MLTLKIPLIRAVQLIISLADQDQTHFKKILLFKCVVGAMTV